MEKHEIIGHQVVCSAFIEKDGKFLIFFCPRFKVWRAPGGRAEYGEKVEETLIREMQEEVGITFENPKFIGFGQDMQFHFKKQIKTSRLILYFHVKTDKTPIIDKNEAEDYKWLSMEEIKKLENMEFFPLNESDYSMEEIKKLENMEGALKDFFERNPDF